MSRLRPRPTLLLPVLGLAFSAAMTGVTAVLVGLRSIFR
jgi:hypothetical protein